MLLNDDRSWLTVRNFNYKWCAYTIIFMTPICTPHVYNCRKIKTNTTVNAQSRILLRDFSFYLLRNINFWNNNVAFPFYVDFSISSIIEKDYYRYWLSNTHGRFLIRNRNWISLAISWVHPSCLLGSMLFIVLVFCVAFLFSSFCVLCLMLHEIC